MKQTDDILKYLDSAIRFQTPVSTDFLKQIKEEIERLKEYEWMYKDLCK